MANSSDRTKLVKYIQQKYQLLNVLVLNHGIVTFNGEQLDISESQYDRMFTVNTKSSFFMLKECLPLLKAGSPSNVLFTSSISADDCCPKVGVYGMTKAAINNIVPSLA